MLIVVDVDVSLSCEVKVLKVVVVIFVGLMKVSLVAVLLVTVGVVRAVLLIKEIMSSRDKSSSCSNNSGNKCDGCGVVGGGWVQ